jgi:hypothetical protein
MAGNESEVKSSLGAVLTWAGGIAGSVIAAVLIYHFTQAPKPVPPPTYPQFGLTGLVTDGSSRQPIANAIVTASFENNIKSYTTDGSGAYAFTMDGAKNGPDVVTVDVVANGYNFFRASNLEIDPGDNYAGFPLISNAPVAVAPTPAPAATGNTAAAQPPAAGPTGTTGVAVHPAFNPGLVVMRVPPKNFVRPGISTYMALKKQ